MYIFLLVIHVQKPLHFRWAETFFIVFLRTLVCHNAAYGKRITTLPHPIPFLHLPHHAPSNPPLSSPRPQSSPGDAEHAHAHAQTA